VGAIICLQQDPDLAYFSLDLGAIRKRCAERKDIEHIRSPIRFEALILFASFWQRFQIAEPRRIVPQESGRGILYHVALRRLLMKDSPSANPLCEAPCPHLSFETGDRTKGS
jgi:hypothetical protein